MGHSVKMRIALSKGLGSGSWMNTGEGGLSDHHLEVVISSFK